MNQITIAAIDGVALGGAACITTALDFRIGTDDCRIGYPEVKLGIPLSWVSLPLCVHLIGPAKAKRMVILGNQEDPKTLLNWGFLDAVVSGDQLMKRAMDMANAYAVQAPVAAQMIKRSINAIMSSHDQALMHMDSDQVLLTQLSGEFKEGVEAFFQKRKPDFKGN
jgi:enoyl-CoA hydratase